jgi:hypothetical protein
MAVDQAKCSKCDWLTSCGDCCNPGAALDGLPDSLVQQHLLPRLSSGDKKVFRCAHGSSSSDVLAPRLCHGNGKVPLETPKTQGVCVLAFTPAHNPL